MGEGMIGEAHQQYTADGERGLGRKVGEDGPKVEGREGKAGLGLIV